MYSLKKMLGRFKRRGTVRDGSMHATGQCTLTPPKHSNPSILTRDNSINISLIKAALAAIKALELEEKLCYIKII
jgi:hypothetical protein